VRGYIDFLNDLMVQGAVEELHSRRFYDDLMVQGAVEELHSGNFT
jgi:hypothetical protein